MSRIKEMLKRDLVDYALNNRQDMIIGKIEHYDHKNARAIVSFPNRQVGGNKEIVLRHVPVNFSDGVHTAGPFVGDKVWIQFQKGNIHQPIVIGRADPQYAHTTRLQRTEHGTKGGYLPYNGITKKDNERALHYPQYFNKSMYSKDWTKELNWYSKDMKGNFENKARVNSLTVKDKKGRVRQLSRGQLAPVEGVLQDATDSAFKGHAEIGLLHPFHTSGIKIKDNAQIDMFTYPNQGIRIDPDTRTINTHSEWMKMHHDQFRAWIKNQAQWRIDGKWVLEVKSESEWHTDGQVEMHSRYGDIQIIAEKNKITIKAKTNVDVISESADVTVTAAKNITMKAGTNIEMTAGSHIGLKAPRIDFN